MPNSGNVDQLDDIGLSQDGVTWHWYHKVRDQSALSTPGAAQPIVRADTGPGEDLPRPQRSWHRGSGWSRLPSDSNHTGVIDYSWPGDTRRERSILPPAKLEELPMPLGVDGQPITGKWTATFQLYWTLGHPDAPGLFALLDHYCMLLDVGATAPVTDYYFGPNFTPLSAAVFAGPAWAGGDGTTGIWRRDTVGWSVGTPPLVNRRYLAVAKVRHGQEMGNGAGTSGKELITLFGTAPLGQPTGFFWCSDDPFTLADWYPGSTVLLGDSGVGWPINSVCAAPSAVAFSKPEGVYIHNGTNSLHLTPYWRDDYDAASGSWSMFYRGHILASHASYLDLVPYSFTFQQAPRKVTPGAPPIPNTSPVHGRVTTGTTVDGDPWVAVYMEALNQTAICAGVPAETVGADGSVSPLIWHFAMQIIPGRVDVMAVTSIANPGDTVSPYLHCLASNAPGISSADTTLKARWFRFRLARGGEPLNDLTYPFAREFQANLTEDDLGEEYAGTNATIRRIAVTSHGGDYAVIRVSVDGGVFEEMGQVTSPGASFRARDELSGRRFKWGIIGRGYEDDPFELRSFIVHYILSPDEVERDVHQIILQRVLTSRDGTTREIEPVAEEQFLRAMQKQGDIHYLDPSGQEWLAKIIPGRQRLFVATGDGNEWATVLTLSIDRIGMVRYWGRGPRYGDGSDY